MRLLTFYILGHSSYYCHLNSTNISWTLLLFAMIPRNLGRIVENAGTQILRHRRSRSTAIYFKRNNAYLQIDIHDTGFLSCHSASSNGPMALFEKQPEGELVLNEWRHEREKNISTIILGTAYFYHHISGAGNERLYKCICTSEGSCRLAAEVAGNHITFETSFEKASE
jgi:hypothetical protein